MLNFIAAVRKQRGLTQQKLAQMVGTESGHLSVLERGKSVPSIYIALRIADALGTDPYKLFPDWNKIVKREKKLKHPKSN